MNDIDIAAKDSRVSPYAARCGELQTRIWVNKSSAKLRAVWGGFRTFCAEK